MKLQIPFGDHIRTETFNKRIRFEIEMGGGELHVMARYHRFGLLGCKPLRISATSFGTYHPHPVNYPEGTQSYPLMLG